MRNDEYWGWSFGGGSTHARAHLWRPAVGNCDVTRCWLRELPRNITRMDGHERCKRCEASERKDKVSV